MDNQFVDCIEDFSWKKPHNFFFSNTNAKTRNLEILQQVSSDNGLCYSVYNTYDTWLSPAGKQCSN